MSLDAEQVKKIAHLARLRIEAADVPGYATNLNNILHMFEQMSAIDTSNVVPMSHPLDAVQRLRPDEVRETDQREVFQRIAPSTENGLYLVPRVIE